MRFEKRASVESKMSIFHSKLSQTGNRASVDWTVGKLLNIILAMVVFALVAYGISTQSLNPLWDNLSGKFDEVKILSPWNNDVTSGDCYEERIANSKDGREFLKAIGMEGKEVILNVCKNRICNISGAGVTPYRVNQGKFEKLEEEKGEEKKWVGYNSLIVEGIGSAKFNWELYNKGVDILETAGVKDLYDKGFTKKFVLYGDGGRLGKDVYAVWQNGEWRVRIGDDIPDGEGWVKEGEKIGNDWVNQTWVKHIAIGFKKYRHVNTYYSIDDEKIINMFAEIVNGVIDYKVYWKETIPTKPDEQYISSSSYGEIIGTFIGNIDNSPDELDDKKEVVELKEEFNKKKEEYLDEAEISVRESEKMNDLKKIVENKEVEINDKTFKVEIENGEIFPIIVFTSNGETFGLKHSAYAKINSNLLKGVKLEYFPVVLIERVGSEWKEIGNEEYYRLPKENFNEVYRTTLISRFLKDRCR